jgi:glycosyltransferase involved in cell wall biosynthesis
MTAPDLQKASAAKEALRRAYRAACGGLTLANVAATRRDRSIAVHYGGARIGDVGGPLVKVKRLAEHFPETRWGYNVVYLLSNAPYLPDYALRVLKARRVPIVYNQNGVFYRAWYGGDWQGQNRRMRSAYLAADHVFFQSEFCRRTAERFIGPRHGTGEILYNAVDTGHFSPGGARAAGPFRFLVTGKIGNHLAYRLESTIEGLALARRKGLDAGLIVSGWVEDGARAAALSTAARFGVGPHLTFTGPFTQAEAPAVYRAADAYVMTKHNDPCPNTVLEALACGLPVVYSANGGSPELVGSEAGVGLECPEDFETTLTPPAEAIATGMLAVAENRTAMSAAARRRAVERFDIAHWIARHRAVFAELLEKA